MKKRGCFPHLHARLAASGYFVFRISNWSYASSIFRTQGLSLDDIRDRIETCESDNDLVAEDYDLPDDRRTKILKAAVVVFPQKGFAATTLQDIAQEAGISASAIYQHFKSKEDLFIALTDNLSFIPILDEINASLDEEKDIGYDDVRRSLIEVGEGFLCDSHT